MELYLPLRRRDGNATVVVVVASGLLADEVFHRQAVLGFPPEGGSLQVHAAPLDTAAAVKWKVNPD